MLKTTVMQRGKANFDMSGRFLGHQLHPVDGCISSGLASRLRTYSLDRLNSAGFKQLVEGWETEVFTADGDESPSQRSYNVSFKNPSGGYIEVVGILTSKGWPSLDHGFEIGQD